MKWINVKWMLPKMSEEILCWVVRDSGFKYYSILTRYRNNEGIDIYYNNEFELKNDEKVTHWMKLPEQPKE